MTPSQAGTYDVSFYASDGVLVDTQLVTITVVKTDRKPVIAAIAPQSVNEGQVLTINISASDPDAPAHLRKVTETV